MACDTKQNIYILRAHVFAFFVSVLAVRRLVPEYCLHNHLMEGGGIIHETNCFTKLSIMQKMFRSIVHD